MHCNWQRMTKERKKKLKDEKKRWRQYRKRDAEKIMDAQKAFYATHPHINVRNGKNVYHNGGGKEAREKIVQERNALKLTAQRAGCKISTRMSHDDIVKCTLYFEKLIEKRDIIRKSGGTESL